MNFSRFQPLIDEVNGRINEILIGRPENLYNASKHIIIAGGKRIRPLICILACRAVGGDDRDVIETAAAIELIHTFTLIHDDIMDEDEFRRGIKSVHEIYGHSTAILAGDLLFSNAFRICHRDVFKILADASAMICEGQEMDISFEKRTDVKEDEYMEMIRKKTAVLLETAAKVGALLGNGDKEEVENLSSFGLNIGIAFQIKDDILGVIADEKKLGKPVGSDIYKCKKNLIAIKSLEFLKNDKRKKLLRILSQRNNTKKEINDAIELFKESGAIEYCTQMMNNYAEMARNSILNLKKSKARDDLLDLSDFIIKREF